MAQALNLHPQGVFEQAVGVLCDPPGGLQGLAMLLSSYLHRNCECKTIPNVINHLCLRTADAPLSESGFFKAIHQGRSLQ